MSTPFRPLEIPPGVVATATKKMRSSNWAQVSNVRWTEGQLSPIGGQSILGYSFASPCRAIHGWFDLNGQYHIAYLCETNLYIDTAGDLTEVTPTDGIAAPGTIVNGGYGTGDYSAGTYGTPRPPEVNVPNVTDLPDVYSLDNFGGVLYAMTSADRRLLFWDPDAAPGPAVITPNAPLGRCFVVTSQRFIQIFGTSLDGTADGGSPRRFAWCDQENPQAWDFSNVTSQAGFLDVEPASPIIAALATRNGTLFWTGKKAYVSQFLGIPYVYNYLELADNCTPWSPQSAVTTAATALWFSDQGMFSFDGTTILPVQCQIRPWIDDNIDANLVRRLACAVHVSDFNEFWWFFPQTGQTAAEGEPTNTFAAIYNYKEGWWSQAVMSRSAGVTAAYNTYTIMAAGTVAYQHESGDVFNNAGQPFAETYDLNLSSGARLITVKQMLPDVEGAIDSLQYSLFYRNSRSKGAPELQTVPIPVRDDGYVDFRTTGRDIRLRIDVTPGPVDTFTIGQHLVDAVPRGDR